MVELHGAERAELHWVTVDRKRRWKSEIVDQTLEMFGNLWNMPNVMILFQKLTF